MLTLRYLDKAEMLRQVKELLESTLIVSKSDSKLQNGKLRRVMESDIPVTYK